MIHFIALIFIMAVVFTMPNFQSRFWNKAPALRLFLPFAAGIALQSELVVASPLVLTAAILLCFLIAVYHFLPTAVKFTLLGLHGVFINCLLLLSGALLFNQQDVRKHPQWVGNFSPQQATIQATLEEPLIEKTNSYKATASLKWRYTAQATSRISGRIILYFKKDAAQRPLGYGSQLLIGKALQPIKSSGNPGAFDFKRYSLFQGITHQVYLTPKDFKVISHTDKNWFTQFVYTSRGAIISTLQKYIRGNREQGLAQALLIGYRDDLDKALVQAYANTGVVHVIAISGLHLGIIYSILLLLTKPLGSNSMKLLRLFLILAGLWAFSFLAGAQPSVLRSAVMFSALAWSTVIKRNSGIYNTLALSAFLLLWYNPYWLWDVGFQLSYLAVLSIIIFYRPLYGLQYFPNKGVNFLWKGMAATLAAQLLTLPVSIYHFNQFPVLFFVANVFAVPLSSLILIGEILLCAFHFVHPVAFWLGQLTEWLIGVMNASVERLDTIGFAVWKGLSVSLLQMVLLYVVIAAAGYWLLEKKRMALGLALVASLLFVSLRTLSFLAAVNQETVLVYNVPRHDAIDLIAGRNNFFLGDEILARDEALSHFHLQPSRTRLRVTKAVTLISNAISFNGKSIVIIDTVFRPVAQATKPVIDLLILCRNPPIYVKRLANAFGIRQIVISSSVPAWKARLWQKDADSLHIPCYNVSEKGAFVMNIHTPTFAPLLQARRNITGANRHD